MPKEYIDREAFGLDLKESYNELKKIQTKLKREDEMMLCQAEISTFVEVMMRLKDFPAADVVEVVHSEWIEHEGYSECKHCHMKTVWPHNYCSKCGAKMDGDKNV